MDLEVAGSGPLAAVCLVPPSFMPYHAQFSTLCFKQDPPLSGSTEEDFGSCIY